jgi:REP element-mobilizing transposase RayT
MYVNHTKLFLALHARWINFPKLRSSFLFSNHFIETGRYTGIVRNERKCILCNLNVLEDEFHFVLQCTKYNDLRKKYIKKYYWSTPSTFKLVQLLSVETGFINCW